MLKRMAHKLSPECALGGLLDTHSLGGLLHTSMERLTFVYTSPEPIFSWTHFEIYINQIIVSLYLESLSKIKLLFLNEISKTKIVPFYYLSYCWLK
jgi:hypothetical protein